MSYSLRAASDFTFSYRLQVIYVLVQKMLGFTRLKLDNLTFEFIYDQHWEKLIGNRIRFL